MEDDSMNNIYYVNDEKLNLWESLCGTKELGKMIKNEFSNYKDKEITHEQFINIRNKVFEEYRKEYNEEPSMATGKGIFYCIEY